MSGNDSLGKALKTDEFSKLFVSHDYDDENIHNILVNSSRFLKQGEFDLVLSLLGKNHILFDKLEKYYLSSPKNQQEVCDFIKCFNINFYDRKLDDDIDDDNIGKYTLLLNKIAQLFPYIYKKNNPNLARLFNEKISPLNLKHITFTGDDDDGWRVTYIPDYIQEYTTAYEACIANSIFFYDEQMCKKIHAQPTNDFLHFAAATGVIVAYFGIMAAGIVGIVLSGGMGIPGVLLLGLSIMVVAASVMGIGPVLGSMLSTLRYSIPNTSKEVISSYDKCLHDFALADNKYDADDNLKLIVEESSSMMLRDFGELKIKDVVSKCVKLINENDTLSVEDKQKIFNNLLFHTSELLDEHYKLDRNLYSKSFNAIINFYATNNNADGIDQKAWSSFQNKLLSNTIALTMFQDMCAKQNITITISNNPKSENTPETTIRDVDRSVKNVKGNLLLSGGTGVNYNKEDHKQDEKNVALQKLKKQ